MQLQHITRFQRPAAGILASLRPHHTDGLRRQVREIRNQLAQGRVHRAKADIEALYPTAPHDFDVLQLMADCQLATGHYGDAVAFYDRALTQQETSEVWAGKGRALLALGRRRRAALAFQRAWALDQQDRHLHAAADCLINAGFARDAYAALGDSAGAHVLRGQALHDMGQADQAFEQAMLGFEPQNAAAVRLARLSARSACDLRRLNIAARKGFLAALKSPKGQAELLAHCLPDHRPYLAQADLARVTAAVSGQAIADPNDAKLHYVLFRHYDFTDERQAALHHLQRFHAQHTGYDRASDRQLFTRLRQLQFSPLRTSKSSILPIFVSGLPGSGRAHAGRWIEAGAAPSRARALPMVHAILTRFMRQIMRHNITEVSRDDLMMLQSDLRAGIAQAAGDDDIVIDTGALNFRWSGLICAALPEARVVHMRGDKMQTGWAMHSRLGQNLPFRHCLTDIRHYQNLSRRLMRHWEARFPNAITSVSGKALSDSTVVSDMLAACQLKGPEQANLGGLEHGPDWRRYAGFLTPLCHST